MISNIVRISLIISFCVYTPFLKAQSILPSIEYAKAIEKGTRMGNGLPGKNYWINHTDYALDVNVKFDNDTVWIIGSGKITYYNESPDTLTKIILRSYPDFFAKGAHRDFDIGNKNEVEPVVYSNIAINGDTISADAINNRKTSTNFVLKPHKNIGSGEKTTISIGWKYMMNPHMSLRQGIYKDKSIFVAYWYPQIAVYDDLYGWDTIEYRGLTEFYNDFNNYDVTITLPEEYFVWAGGVLQNPGEVYSIPVLEKYDDALNGVEKVNILTEEDLRTQISNGGKKTWHFKSENIPDFTFAASKTHIWDAQSLTVAPSKKVLVSTVYTPENSIYTRNTKWACEAIEYFTHTCPQVPFPFPRMTIFNNQIVDDGAMESPMMVNSGNQQTADMAREVTFHEIAHTYQPFLLGTNERRFAWMDEGWATFQGNKWSNVRSGTIIDMFRELFNQIDSTSLVSPLMIPSYQILGYNAETFHAYVRSSQALLVMENQLGIKKMNQGWELFTENWRGKHASPWDFFATFNTVAGENIDWLINSWFYEYKYADLAIERVDTINSTVTILNKGGLPLPVYLNVNYFDSSTVSIYFKPDVFKMANQYSIKLKRAKNIGSIELGNELFFDRDATNNRWIK